MYLYRFFSVRGRHSVVYLWIFTNRSRLTTHFGKVNCILYAVDEWLNSECSTEPCLEKTISLLCTHLFCAFVCVSISFLTWRSAVGSVPLGYSDRLRIHMVQASLIHTPTICAASVPEPPAHILYNSHQIFSSELPERRMDLITIWVFFLTALVLFHSLLIWTDPV